jgi:hypothetical protein
MVLVIRISREMMDLKQKLRMLGIAEKLMGWLKGEML